jgi:hypothetical protein
MGMGEFNRAWVKAWVKAWGCGCGWGWGWATLLCLAVAGVGGCGGATSLEPDPDAAPDADPDLDDDVDYGTQDVVLKNEQTDAADVYITWQGTSVYGNSDWDACKGQAMPYCKTSVGGKASVTIPNASKKWMNLNLSFNKSTFGATNQCNATLAEVDVNNPNWYAVMDVSVVNGFNEKIQINAGSTTLGPAVGKTGNQNVFGVFPYGCTTCTALNGPPCGDDGVAQCHPTKNGGPDPVCQYQMNASGTVEVILLK